MNSSLSCTAISMELNLSMGQCPPNLFNFNAPPPPLVHFLYEKNTTFIGGVPPPPLQAKTLFEWSHMPITEKMLL